MRCAAGTGSPVRRATCGSEITDWNRCSKGASWSFCFVGTVYNKNLRPNGWMENGNIGKGI